MMIKTGDFTWKVHSTQMSPIGAAAGINVIPSNIHIMAKEPFHGGKTGVDS